MKKNLLKLLLFSVAFVSAMDASGFKRLGQKLSKFGRQLTPGVLVASVLQQSNYIETSGQALPAASWNGQAQSEELQEYFKQYNEVKEILDNAFKNDSGTLLKEKYPEFYEYCKQKQKELGLQDVDLEFYLVSDLPERILMRLVTLAPPLLKNGDLIVHLKFKIKINKKIFAERLKTGGANIDIRHELQHVLQHLTQTVHGRGPGLHEGEAVYFNANLVQSNSVERRLKEQNADAAACGDCMCPKCLMNLVFELLYSDLARMTSEGYCVSLQGYLSALEILAYADARRIDGQLCPKHAQNHSKS